MSSKTDTTDNPQANLSQTPSPSIASIEQPRTFTYRLRGGASLTEWCPDWCIGYKTHKGDLDGTIHPTDLYHEGDVIQLSFTTGEGERDTILAARITQYPFCTDGSEVPHIALMPVAGNGETLGCQSPGQVYAAIRRVENHLLKLRTLADKLAEACAKNHAAITRSLGLPDDGESRPTWTLLQLDDIRTMPVSYLVKAFAAGVVEVEPDETTIDGEISSTHPGDIVLLLRRDLTQEQRERAVRTLLLSHFYEHAQVQA